MVTEKLISYNMKLMYNKPAAEELERLLETAILAGSIEGDLESYGNEIDYVW